MLVLSVFGALWYLAWTIYWAGELRARRGACVLWRAPQPAPVPHHLTPPHAAVQDKATPHNFSGVLLGVWLLLVLLHGVGFARRERLSQVADERATQLAQNDQKPLCADPGMQITVVPVKLMG